MGVRRKKTVGIVIHRAEVWTPTDYHGVIMRSGTFETLVQIDQVAYHAKKFNSSTIGIAVFGDFAPAERSKYAHPTREQLLTLVDLCLKYRSKYGNLWIKGHTELGPDGTAYPEKLTPEHACPGSNLDLDALRQAVADSEKAGQCLVEPFYVSSKTRPLGNV